MSSNRDLRQVDRGLRSALWAAVSIFVVSLCRVPLAAAEEPRPRLVAVLAIESDQLIDEVAKGLRQAVCDALASRPGWAVHPTQASLAQLSFAHDCAPTEVACLRSIAQQFQLDGLVFGRMSHEAGAIVVRLSRFDPESGTIERNASLAFASQDATTDGLAWHGRALTSELFDHGVLQVAAKPASLPSPAAPSRPGEVSAGRAVTDDGVSARTVIGYSSLAVAVVTGGLAVFSAVQVAGAQDDAAFDAYRRAVGRMKPEVEDVCAEIETGADYGLSSAQLAQARGSCSHGKTYQVLQFVFLGAALASGGVGAFLLLGGGPDRAPPPKPGLALAPAIGKGSLGLHASWRF